jgi:hypothetical protein
MLAFHEAHVEAAEQGTHSIRVADQAGCTVLQAHAPSGSVLTPVNGQVTVQVSVKNHTAGDATYYVDVDCA